jgi:DNA-binding NarL/FixJ family response regulator
MSPLFNLTNWRRIKRGPGTVAALLAVEDPGARRAIKSAILRDIPANIAETGAKKDFHHSVTFSEIDLIIADADLAGETTFDLVEQIRFGRLHCHAFPIIILLTSTQRGHGLQQLIDCGADLLIPAGNAADTIPDHIARLTDRRAPFVVTPHYVGPERRTAWRKGEPSADQIEVPNPLIARAGAIPEEEYRRQVSVATHNISVIRSAFYSIRHINGVPSKPTNDNKSLLV